LKLLENAREIMNLLVSDATLMRNSNERERKKRSTRTKEARMIGFEWRGTMFYRVSLQCS